MFNRRSTAPLIIPTNAHKKCNVKRTSHSDTEIL